MASGGHPLPDPRGLRGHQHHRPGHPLGGRDLRRRGPVLILKDGVVDTSLSDGAAASRTAVGTKPNGEVVFLHHRRPPGRPHSVGATIQMVAQRLKELGCTNAILLDGRRVHHHGVHLPGLWFLLHHQQALGRHPRAVSNAVFLLSNLSPTNQPGSLYVTPKSLTLLPGATTQCTVSAMDTGWYPMDELPERSPGPPGRGGERQRPLYRPQTPGVYTVTAESSGSPAPPDPCAPGRHPLPHRRGHRQASLLLLPHPRAEGEPLPPGPTEPLTSRAGTAPSSGPWRGDIGTITDDGQFTAYPQLRHRRHPRGLRGHGRHRPGHREGPGAVHPPGRL